MGGCTVKSTHTHLEAESKVSIPSCYYFCRNKKNLFKISSDKVEKYKFKGKLKCYPDSGTGLTSKGEIILAGGTDSSGSLTTRVFVIKPEEFSGTELSPVPRPIKEGHLFEYEGYYYYIGGTCESESVDAMSTIEGAPVFRYSKKEKNWEVFSHNKDPKSGIEKALNRNITDKEECEEIILETARFSLKDLISPGVFLFSDKAYLVGGKVFANGEFKITNKIHSINLKDDKFEFCEENLELPIKLINPVCASGGSHAIITGGILESHGHNTEIYVIKFSSGTVSKFESKLDSELKENYPPTYTDKEVIFFGFPKLWVKPKDQDKTHSFTFKRKDKEGKTKDGSGYKSQEIKVNKHASGKAPLKQQVDLSLRRSDGETKHKNHKHHKHHKKSSSSSSSNSKKGHKGKGKIGLPVVSAHVEIKKHGKNKKSSSSSGYDIKAKKLSGTIDADVRVDLKRKSSSSSSSNKKKVKVSAPKIKAEVKAQPPKIDAKIKISGNKSSSSSSSSGKKKVKVNAKVEVPKLPKIDAPKAKVEVKIGGKKSSSSSSSSSSKKGKAKIGIKAEAPKVKVEPPKVEAKINIGGK